MLHLKKGIHQGYRTVMINAKTLLLSIGLFLLLPFLLTELLATQHLVLEIITTILSITGSIIIGFSLITIGFEGNKKQLTLQESIRHLPAKIIPLIGTSILVLGISVLSILPGIIIGIGLISISEVLALSIAIPISILGLLVSGTFLIFTTYEVLFSKHTYIQALQSSYDVVKKRFWNILGFIVVVQFIAIILASLINLPLLFMQKNNSY